MAAKPTPKPKKSEAVKSQETMKQVPKAVVIPKKIKPTPSSTLSGSAAIEQYKRETSPGGIARAEAEARKALEKKYPGMFIPEKRTTTMIPRR
jgi:hypothetical protein